MMRVLSLRRLFRSSSVRRNLLAAIVSTVALGMLHINFDPSPAGADPAEAEIDLARFTGAGVGEMLGEQFAMAELAGNKEESNSSSASDSVADKISLLKQNIQLLERAVSHLESVPDYTATFFKRELVNGSMSDGQVMNLKLRHEPFSVYMKWAVGDIGRELLFVNGENDGSMLVKVGGIKGRLLPCVKLDPNGSMAQSEARHPVTKLGLLNLANELLHHRKLELAHPECAGRYRFLKDQKFDGVLCDCFVLDYDKPDERHPYRRSIQYFEKKHSMPICVMNYGWPSARRKSNASEPDESDLIEHYSYSDIRMDQKLADLDFDRTNKNYRLHR